MDPSHKVLVSCPDFDWFMFASTDAPLPICPACYKPMRVVARRVDGEGRTEFSVNGVWFTGERGWR